MAIIDFSAFNQYQYSGTKLLLNTTNFIRPAFKGVTPRWIYNTNYYTCFLEAPEDEIIEEVEE